jgi:tRNA(adenine34) deaminase
MGADSTRADRIASAQDEVSRRTLIAGALGGLALPIASAALLAPSPAHARAIAQTVEPDDERFMRLAIAEAARGDYPFGSVIVRGGKVLAKGRNLGKQQKDPTAHGEMVAIRRFLARHGPDQLKGTTLYTSGESCAMCMGAILWCGISRLVYGASIAELATKIGQIMVTDTEIADKTPFADIAITGGVLAAESLALFK